MRSSRNRLIPWALAFFTFTLWGSCPQQARAIGRDALQDLIAQLGGDLEVRKDRFDDGVNAPVELRVLTKPGDVTRAERIVETSLSALGRLSQWLGAYPLETLTVIDASWHRRMAHSAPPGTVVVRSRWVQPSSDTSLERSVIGGITRQYWAGASAPGFFWFEEGAALYIGARAINEQLQGRHWLTERFFGGFVPYTIRSVVLSRRADDPKPIVRRFRELDIPDVPSSGRWRSLSEEGRAERASVAFHALERRIGWPSLQQALAALLEQSGDRPVTPASFAAVLREQRGVDSSTWLADAFRFDARFDYAVAGLVAEPSLGAPGRLDTRVVLQRLGDGVAPGLRVLVRFEDGSEASETWDGREAELDLSYSSISRPVYAAVDPEIHLVLDVDRTNNVRNLQPTLPRTGARVALNWLVWLQDVMLTYTALV